MKNDGWTTVHRGKRRDRTRRGAPRKKTTAPFNWRDYSQSLDNDANGDCWWLAPLQVYLVGEGLPPSEARLALTKDGKNAEYVEQLEKLGSLFRTLTVEAFEHDHSEAIRSGLHGTQSAFTPDEIREMALTVTRPISNATDWINSILFPGGYGDDKAVLLLAKLLRIPRFAVVKPVVSSGDRVLQPLSEASEYSTSADIVNMVMLHNGHFEAIVSNDEVSQVETKFLTTVVYLRPPSFARISTRVIWKNTTPCTTNILKR